MIDQSVRVTNSANQIPDQTPCNRCHWPKFRHVDGDEKACPMFISKNQLALL